MRKDESNDLVRWILSNQTSSADQAACPAGGVGAADGAFDTAAHRDAMIKLLNEIRTTLIAFGMMKGSA